MFTQTELFETTTVFNGVTNWAFILLTEGMGLAWTLGELGKVIG